MFHWLGQLSTSHSLEVVCMWLVLVIYSLVQLFTGSSAASQSPITIEPSLILVLILGLAKAVAATLLLYRLRHLGQLETQGQYRLRWGMVLCIGVSVLVSTGLFRDAPLDQGATFGVLLADLAQFPILARAAQVKGSLAEGVSWAGPDLVLDTLAKGLAVGVAAVCGEAYIESVSRFVCVQLIVFAAALLTFYPAFLHLSVEVPGSSSRTIPDKVLDSEEHHGNRAQRNVKLVMTGALCVLHLHNKLNGTLVLAVQTSTSQTVVSSAGQWVMYHKLDNYCVVAYLALLVLINWCTQKWQPKKRTGSPRPTVTPMPKPASVPATRPVNERHPPPLHCSREGDEMRTRKRRRLTSQHSRSPDPVATNKCLEQVKQGLGASLSDSDLMSLLTTGSIKTRQLEGIIRDHTRAVEIRRGDLANRIPSHALDKIPYEEYDYGAVAGQCCEEVIGYIPLPLGKVGPLLVDGKAHYVPLATTEGCLVASTNRGCRVVEQSGGVTTVVYGNQMTRAPVVQFPSVVGLGHCKQWIDSRDGFHQLKTAFDSTSAHADLQSILAVPCGRNLHIRFSAATGEAMGMNMVSKGTEQALRVLQQQFTEMRVVALSGNLCTDKKASAINWLLGRGKSVVAECRIPRTVLESSLHCSAERLAALCVAKNWTGSAMAGASAGGYNAHAANLVAGIFAATGQDIAQVVESSSCLTQIEAEEDGSAHVTCTLPCLEVGTVGGGTRLPGQRGCLEMLDLCVSAPTQHLARVCAACVLAGEVSLMAALDTGDLVKSHMLLNRAPGHRVEPVREKQHSGIM